MRTGPKTSGSPRGYRRRRHRPREVWSSPQRWTDGLGGRRDGRWPSRTPRTGSRWWLWYRPMCPPDPESEGFRRPSDREDIDYRVRGQLGLNSPAAEEPPSESRRTILFRCYPQPSQEGTQAEPGIGLREPAQAAIGGELGAVEVSVEEEAGRTKGIDWDTRDLLRVLSITSAYYPASRDASSSFTSSLLQECPSASATWRRISATSLRRAGSRGSLLAHDLTPAPGPVMRNDGPKHSDERFLVDRLPPIDGHGPSRLVFVTRGDDALRIRDEGVVEKHVHVVFCRQERADVAVQDEVRTVGAFDGLRHLGISGVHQSAYPAADTLLPVWERLDVSVDAGIVGRLCHDRFRIASS